jgi:hypothetical protein
MRRIALYIVSGWLALSFAAAAYAASGPATVLSAEGEVIFAPAGTTVTKVCKAGEELEAGDLVKTGKASSAVISFDREKKNLVRVDELTSVVLNPTEDDRLELVDGEIFATLKGLEKGEAFRVKTPSATCGARGTGWETLTDGDTTDVAVLDGTIFTTAINRDGTPGKKEFPVGEGFGRRIGKFQAPGSLRKLSEEKMKSLKKGRRYLAQFMGSNKKPKETRLNGRDRRMDSRREKMIESREDIRDRDRLREIREDKRVKDLPRRPNNREIGNIRNRLSVDGGG